MTGRPTKLTPEVQDKIVTALRAGNYQETAARYAGINHDTFYEWMRRGKDEPGSIFSDFAEAVEKAKADAEVRDVALIDRAAADGNWQAAAWKLERKFPNRWGRVNRTEVTGADGGALKVEIDHKAALLDLLGLSDADSDDG
jgi:alpha-galactosidase/6-phospho-beta-glucosidase family protein